MITSITFSARSILKNIDVCKGLSLNEDLYAALRYVEDDKKTDQTMYSWLIIPGHVRSPKQISRYNLKSGIGIIDIIPNSE